MLVLVSIYQGNPFWVLMFNPYVASHSQKSPRELVNRAEVSRLIAVLPVPTDFILG